LERHARKIKEIALLLGLMVEDLKEIASELKTIISDVSTRTKQAGSEQEIVVEAEKIKGESPVEPLTLGKVQSMLPENLLSKIYLEDAGGSIIVRPREFLTRDEFQEIARTACDELGGAYISAGKNSRFIIPKEKTAI